LIPAMTPIWVETKRIIAHEPADGEQLAHNKLNGMYDSCP
jgi:hypothetical protein